MNRAGFIQVRTRIFRFNSATCIYNRRTVDVYGSSKTIRVKLCALPIPGTGTPESLVGQEFLGNPSNVSETRSLRPGFHAESRSDPEFDDDEDDDDLDLFTLSRVEIDQMRWLRGDRVIRAACLGYNPAQNRLTVEFEVTLRDQNTEETFHAEGSVSGDLILEDDDQ